MKIRFYYKEYKDYPEATKISKFRGILWTFYSIALSFTILFAIVSLIEDFSTSWYIAIPLLILCIITFGYLLSGYPAATERKIARVINGKNQATKKMIEEKYKCLYIYHLDTYKRGHCEKCGIVSEHLRECAVKDRDGDQVLYLCSSCITKYTQNKV